MKISMTALVAALLLSHQAHAAVSASEASKLGQTLTIMGAEKAGNAEKTIPAYTGGLSKVPAGLKVTNGKRPSPFDDEKPSLVIKSQNVASYNAKLTEGTKTLFKKYPDFRMDVYPTHRTVAFPQSVLDATRKCAETAELINNNNGVKGAKACIPFPIPKNGSEAIWNHKLRYEGKSYEFKYEAYNVDRSGRAVMASKGENIVYYPFQDASNKTDQLLNFWINYTGPARRAGERLLVIDPLDDVAVGRRAWQYMPGQRRTKLAPNVAYDAPNPSTAGASTYDDALMYNGAIDRYDWKLVGKKEMYVPYNNYKLSYFSSPEEALKPNFINPDVVRWELHRVWEVEATLKPNKRHIYSKRTFYLDEDSWNIMASDQYDARGQLYRSGFAFMTMSYDEVAPFTSNYVHYDFTAQMYAMNFWPSCSRCGLKYMPVSPGIFSPDSMAGTGIR